MIRKYNGKDGECEKAENRQTIEYHNLLGFVTFLRNFYTIPKWVDVINAYKIKLGIVLRFPHNW